MKRIVTLLMLVVLFVSACTSPAASTSAPTVQVEATPMSQPTEAVVVENTATAVATFTPEPTTTPTPVPPPPHWYWTVDSDTAKVIAVNQFGEKHEIGAVDQADSLNTSSISLDNERALLFLDRDNNLRVYLLTPDGMQKIAFPSDPFYFNTDFSQTSRAVVALHNDSAVFSYVTQQSTNSMPDTGPVFLLDLKSLTAKLIDETVSRGSYSNNRYWLHTSQDGRYLRYLNGDKDKMDIRELDLVTGDARTIYTTDGSSYNIHASPQGDLWYLRDSKIILDLNGNKKDFPDASLAFWPLADGKGVVFPRECADNCEIKVVSPFGNDAELTYKLPWGTRSGSFNGSVSQLLPDQSLLFVGSPLYSLKTTPAIMQTYPDLKKDDNPVFRLTTDGQARLVGAGEGNISPDGRFLLMRSPDQASFFMYDAITDQPLFNMPIDSGLVDYLSDVRFFDAGNIVNLSAAVPDTGNNDYRYFYHDYVYETSTSSAWEDVKAEINSCSDLFEDGSLVCWMYRPDSSNFDLVRFDPATGTKTVLMENGWLIDTIQ
jgi:hypothetical protein